MLILMSSRLSFTFTDFSDSGKSAIAGVLIGLLIVVMLSLFIPQQCKTKMCHDFPRKPNVSCVDNSAQAKVITPSLYKKYCDNCKKVVCIEWANHHFHNGNVLEIDRDYLAGLRPQQESTSEIILDCPNCGGSERECKVDKQETMKAQNVLEKLKPLEKPNCFYSCLKKVFQKNKNVAQSAKSTRDFGHIQKADVQNRELQWRLSQK
jgi:hypothetical protein